MSILREKKVEFRDIFLIFMRVVHPKCKATVTSPNARHKGRQVTKLKKTENRNQKPEKRSGKIQQGDPRTQRQTK